MKKKIQILLAAIILTGTFSIPALAGSINAAEQKIINAISSVYTYDGAYYKVTDAYISQVSAYLSQDGIEMSDSEAEAYLDQFYANIGVGISSGYMECVGYVESDSDEGNETDSDNKEEKSEAKDKLEETAETNEGVETENVTAETAFEEAVTVQVQDEENMDNTLGSTIDGVQEYTVMPVENQDMYVWDIEELDVHAEAYKDSELLGTLEKGTKVIVTGAATTGWAQIEYEGKTAYVSSAYLRTPGYMTSIGFEIEETTIEETTVVEETQTEPAETQTEEGKDYSDAEPFQGGVSLGVIALVIVLLVAAALAGVLFAHKNKRFKRK